MGITLLSYLESEPVSEDTWLFRSVRFAGSILTLGSQRVPAKYPIEQATLHGLQLSSIWCTSLLGVVFVSECDKPQDFGAKLGGACASELCSVRLRDPQSHQIVSGLGAIGELEVKQPGLAVNVCASLPLQADVPQGGEEACSAGSGDHGAHNTDPPDAWD